MSNSLRPHKLQHTRLLCLSLRACSNSYPLSQWCNLTISSSDIPSSSCPQFSPASGSFPVSQLFASSGQSIGASASVDGYLEMNELGLEWASNCSGRMSPTRTHIWKMKHTHACSLPFFPLHTSLFLKACSFIKDTLTVCYLIFSCLVLVIFKPCHCLIVIAITKVSLGQNLCRGLPWWSSG